MQSPGAGGAGENSRERLANGLLRRNQSRVRGYIFSHAARFKALTRSAHLTDRCEHIFPTLSMLHEAIVPRRSAA